MAGRADWQHRVAEDAQRYRELNERAAALTVTEKSRDGMVKVTVSATGVLTELVLKERWRPIPEPEVAEQIMACVKRAQAKIPELMAKLIEETLGAQDASTHLILADARRSFPEPPPEPTSREAWQAEPPPPPKERQEPKKPKAVKKTAPAGTDDWDGRPFLEDV